MLLAAVGAHALLVPGGLRPLARHLWTVCSVGYLLWLPAPLAVRLVSIATVCALAFVSSRPMPRAHTLLTAALAPVVAATAIGVNRQIAVSAYTFGDGFSNLVYPTNAALIITLSLTVVAYPKWVKWLLGLWFWVILATVAFLAVAVAIDYGPF